MAPIYEFAIRFITVKDLSKVNTKICDKQRKNFDQYLVDAKANRLRKLREIRFRPAGKRGYKVCGLTVPADCDVITFGNDASYNMGAVAYTVDFHYKDEEDDYDTTYCTKNERSRFMVIPERNESGELPRTLDYTIMKEEPEYFEKNLTIIDYDVNGNIIYQHDPHVEKYKLVLEELQEKSQQDQQEYYRLYYHQEQKQQQHRQQQQQLLQEQQQQQQQQQQQDQEDKQRAYNQESVQTQQKDKVSYHDQQQEKERHLSLIEQQQQHYFQEQQVQEQQQEQQDVQYNQERQLQRQKLHYESHEHHQIKLHYESKDYHQIKQQDFQTPPQILQSEDENEQIECYEKYRQQLPDDLRYVRYERVWKKIEVLGSTGLKSKFIAHIPDSIKFHLPFSNGIGLRIVEELYDTDV